MLLCYYIIMLLYYYVIMLLCYYVIMLLCYCVYWGLGIGDWGLGPIPNPQSPIPIHIIHNKHIIEKY